MKFNVLVVAAMVITSVNAGGKGRLPSCLGGRCTSRSGSRKGLLEHEEGPPQESDPNETGPTCDDLEAKLRGLYDNISVRNSRVWLDMPELYKIMKGNMGRMVENVKSGVETEVAQKSDGNEMGGSPQKTCLEDLPLVRWHYKTAQAQDTNESGADISNKQDDNDQEKMQESNP
ncbi:hypothetical protein BASA62_009724 [Batrachochytrium salamandrivorans]|nr:hypothetical protein BASA62_009724 [Batrachochytrium salamandrivorans]